MTSEPRKSPTVWDATARDVPALAATLARAFHDDPIMTWILPDQRSRTARLTAMFALLARHAHLPKAGVELASRLPDASSVDAVALWDPPGEWRLPLATQVRHGAAFLRVFGARLPAAMRVVGRFEGRHPERPHWYLSAIGTDPAAQGHGLGSALLRSRLDRCDAAGLPAYLESSKPSNVPFYERHGFRVTEELAMPGDCPPVWLMWRDPR